MLLSLVSFHQILGIIDQPVLRERWIGITGKRTTLNGQEVSTRTCADLSQAYLYAFLLLFFCKLYFEYVFDRDRKKGGSGNRSS